MSLLIKTIPAFSDNYIWLFHQSNSKNAFVVDPGAAEPVLACLKEASLNLAGILVTHQHPDHIGGIAELCQHYPDAIIFGPGDISLVNNVVTNGCRFSMADTEFTTIAVPGHTLNHLAFFAKPTNESPILFCGDTLFAGGCGRLFEGTAIQMLDSLNRLSALPEDTRVYCAHEYTQANLAFAALAEPSNQALKERIAKVTLQRKSNLPTVPSTIALEKQTNPFLRSAENSVKIQIEQKLNRQFTTEIEVFTAIRQWKDNV